MLRFLVFGKNSCHVDDFSDEPWNDVALVRACHVHRVQWNNAALRKMCQESGRSIFVEGKQTEDGAHRRTFLEIKNEASDEIIGIVLHLANLQKTEILLLSLG